MREAVEYEKLPENLVRCHTCQWFCRILTGRFGVCRMYRNVDGILYNLNFAEISSAAIDPIEKKPLFHLYPGSRCFSLGSWGCNFHCKGCQNWEIACVNEVAPSGRAGSLSPERAVQLTIENDCEGIAWTYNEPSVGFDYTLESARLARQAGLYSVYVTNGYLSSEALDRIGPYLTAWRVDIKGFNDESYFQQAGIRNWQGILEVARRARERWGMHVEVVSNLIPGINSDPEQLTGIAHWIADQLGPLTPWHVTRFHPDRNLLDHPATSPEILESALEIGHREGLRFVYIGNMPGHPGENTVCYNCGTTVIRRLGYEIEILCLDGSRCASCAAELNVRHHQGGMP